MDNKYFYKRLLEEYEEVLIEEKDTFEITKENIRLLLNKIKEIIELYNLENKNVYAKIGKDNIENRMVKYKNNIARTFYDISLEDKKIIMQVRINKDLYLRTNNIYFSVIFDTKENIENNLFNLVYFYIY